MLSLQGIICKELKKQGKLLEKYEDLAMNEIWKNTLWLNSTSKFEGTEIKPISSNTDSNDFFFFACSANAMPIDLAAKDWSFIMCANVTSTSMYDSTGQGSQVGFMIFDHSDKLFQFKTFKSEIHFFSYGGPDTSIAKGTTKIGSNWMRLDYKASSMTATAYYSSNGTSWTKIGSRSQTSGPVITKIWQNHRAATVPVSSIRFVYDGEVLFSV